MKKIIITFLCLMMVLLNGCTPQTPSDPESDYSEDWRSRPLPETFDLRSVDTDGDGQGDRRYVTPVRLQNPFGTCWGFAAIAAAEISILGNNLKNDKDAWKTLDLSEKQLAYFTNVPLDDPNNPQNGEGATPVDINDSWEVYDKGGNCILATSTFAQGVGPSYEYDEKYNDYFTYRGRNHYADYRYLDGEYRGFSYAGEDDWTIPEDYRFKRDFILSYTHLLPSPAQRNLTGNYVYNLDATNLIKEELLQKKGVLIGFSADTSRPSEDVTEGVYIELTNWAHYTWNLAAPVNHAVTIIGWDDNYPKENFIKDHQPPQNGAWLVKNSWGSGEEDFPASGLLHWGIEVPKVDEKGNPVLDENGNAVMVGSGYFWLSYYDMSITSPETFTFAKAPEYEEHIYQHDYLSVTTMDTKGFENPISISNVFTSGHSETLKEISCVTTMDLTNVDYQVYLLPDDYKTPDDGYLVISGSKVFEFAGYHRIPFVETIDLQEGQKYSVIMTMQSDYINYVPTPIGLSVRGLMDQRAVINPMESFIKDSEGWYDFKQVVDEEWALDNPYEGIGGSVNYDNFPIKAYTEYKPEGNMNIILTSDRKQISLNAGSNTQTVVCNFRGYDEIKIGNPEIKWQLMPGSEEIVDMQVNPEGRSVIITAKKNGTAHVAATVDGIGTSILAVLVKPIIPKTFLPVTPTLEYTGEPLEASLLALSETNVVMKEGVDYKLRFFNNVNCGIATIELLDPDGNPFDPVLLAYFAIVPNKAEITSARGSNGTIQVTVADQWASGITGYELEYRAEGAEEWTIVQVTEGNVLTAEGLAKGSYEVRARAFVDTSKAEKDIYNANAYYGGYSEVSKVSL